MTDRTRFRQWIDRAIRAIEKRIADRPMSKELAELVRERAREHQRKTTVDKTGV